MISSFHLFSHPYPFHLQLLLPGLRHRCSFELSTSANQKKEKKMTEKKIKDNIDNFLVHEWDLEILMIKPLLRLCACAGGGGSAVDEIGSQRAGVTFSLSQSYSRISLSSGWEVWAWLPLSFSPSVYVSVFISFSLRPACALRLVALEASWASRFLSSFHFRWRGRKSRFPFAARSIDTIFLIIFRDKQKNDAKHSLAAIEKKTTTQHSFLIFWSII